MNDEYISVTEAEQRIGIPTVTIRRYIVKHGHHFRVSKRHKSYQIAIEALETLVQIRDFYAAGLDTDGVEEKLVRSGKPTIIDVNDVNDEKDRIIAEQAAALERMNEGMILLAQELERVRADIDHVVERRVNEAVNEIIAGQKAIVSVNEERIQRAIDEALSRHNERMNDEIERRAVEMREQLAATRAIFEEERKRSVWSKIFGR